MNVYDFDNTIYRGESSMDFFLYCVKQNPKQLKFLPAVVLTLIRYKMCKITHHQLLDIGTKYAKEFIKNVKNIDTVAKDFWDKHQHNIKDFYLKIQEEDDCIVSASPSFLLDEITKRLHIKNCICSRVDKSTGEVKCLCFSHEKTRLFKENFPDVTPKNFYTDSLNDKPMMEISENVYLVKNNKITKIK